MEKFYQTLTPHVLGVRDLAGVFHKVATFERAEDCERVCQAMRLAETIVMHQHNPGAVAPYLADQARRVLNIKGHP